MDAIERAVNEAEARGVFAEIEREQATSLVPASLRDCASSSALLGKALASRADEAEFIVMQYHKLLRRAYWQRDAAKNRKQAKRYADLARKIRLRMWREVFGR